MEICSHPRYDRGFSRESVQLFRDGSPYLPHDEITRPWRPSAGRGRLRPAGSFAARRTCRSRCGDRSRCLHAEGCRALQLPLRRRSSVSALERHHRYRPVHRFKKLSHREILRSLPPFAARSRGRSLDMARRPADGKVAAPRAFRSRRMSRASGSAVCMGRRRMRRGRCAVSRRPCGNSTRAMRPARKARLNRQWPRAALARWRGARTRAGRVA